MLKHVVIIKFKAGVGEAEVKDLEGRFAALPGRIPEIREYIFGPDVVRSERSYDFALVSAFEDVDSLKRYQVHPDHVALVGRIRELADSILAVDFCC